MRNCNKNCFQVIMFLSLAIASPVIAFAETLSAINENAITPAGKYQASPLWPNPAGKSLTIPNGWGASGGLLFIGAGISNPQVYSKRSDAAVSLGVGVGNPAENLGVQLSTTMNDVSRADNFSYGFKFHRYLGYGSSLAVGGENLFADKKKNDAGESYYIVASHAFQQFHSNTPGLSSLHATLGVGSGRFGEKSPLDIQTGKGSHGTYIFGSIAYEIFKSTNFIVEWNGLNLCAGVSVVPFKTIPFGISVGVGDLTHNSGDGPRLLLSAGFSHRF